MKKTSKYLMLLLMATLGLSSCVDDLNVKNIDPTVTSDINNDQLLMKVYATLGSTGQEGPSGDADFNSADEGASGFYRILTECQEFPADMILWIWSDAGVKDMTNASWTPSNELLRDCWSRLYFNITMCNSFLDIDNDKVRLAEVRTLRAIYYWVLIDMFGNVPHVTSMSSELPALIKRPELYKWIESELLAAEQDLPDKKLSYFRLDKAAAQIMLARLYLNSEVYTNGEVKDYDKAAQYAYKVISNKNYDLASQYRFLFMGDNDENSAVNDAYKEIILPIQADGQHLRSYAGAQFLIAATHTVGMPEYGSKDYWTCIRSRRELVKLFFPTLRPVKITDKENATTDDVDIMEEIKAQDYYGDWHVMTEGAKDDRALFCNFNVYEGEIDGKKVKNMIFYTNMGQPNTRAAFQSGWSIEKFRSDYADPARKPSDLAWTDMDAPFLRVAEAYLTYAEALLRGGASQGMTSDEAINTLRRRAHAEEKSGYGLDDVLAEWGREFYCEGRRRSDLVRFGKFGGDNGYYWEMKAGVQAGKHFEKFRDLYPIPATEINNNRNLVQNEGY